ncbi:MAG: SRPBCC domain-containing protein [Ferruginibacter sp.]
MSERELEPLHTSCHFDVPPEAIFDAWINPAIIRKWLFAGPGSEITNVEVDLKEGGSYSIIELESSSGESIEHFGKYQEIEEPLQLVLTLNVPKQFPGESIVTIHIFPTLNGCELKLTQAGASNNSPGKSWADMLHALKHLVEEKARNREEETR